MAPCVQHYTTINKILINLRPELRYHQAGSRHINIIIYTFFHSIKIINFLFLLFLFLNPLFYAISMMSHKTLYNPEVFMMRPEQTSEDWEPDFQDQGNISDTEPAFRDILYNLCFNRDKHFFDRIVYFSSHIWINLTRKQKIPDIRLVEELLL